MGRALSSKEKISLKNIVKRFKNGSNSDRSIFSGGLDMAKKINSAESETVEESFDPCGEEGGEKKPEQIQRSQSVASEIFPQEDSKLVAVTPTHTFKFNKVMAGSTTIVEVIRSDGRVTNQGFPNNTEADKFISAQKAKLEELINNSHPNKVKKISDSLKDDKNGDFMITSRDTGKKLIAPLELKSEVVKWLNGRSVSNWRVDTDGSIILVTYPCAQKAIFKLHPDGRATVERR